MKVLKASAGSGKTYTLSKTFIDKLLSSTDRYEYRHLLAVTFTNKATAEMKGRILSDLYRLSATDMKARRILTDILHDYSAFSVSTIDRFFQQALKAFSREIGQFAAYQIELDRDSLIKEATDRILDGLTEDDHDVIDWLRRNVETAIEQGRKFSIDEGLVDMGKRIKNDEHRKLSEEHGVTDTEQFSKERLSKIRKRCHQVIAGFHSDVKSAAQAVAPSIKGATATRLLQQYLTGFKLWETVPEPKVTLAKATEGTAFAELFGKRFREYNTARLIDGVLFSLGLSGEFIREFDSLVKEKNVMPLDDSNTILRDIIDGSDAPFVYEKLGVKYTSYLLDEFQDTSILQWLNFLPLLKESESTGSGSLVVGDVKQSIYRWRNSDWCLLGEEVGRQFPDARTEPLDCNWRSVKNVVGFNNAFFEHAARLTGLEGIYADVRQKVMSKDEQGGGVRVSFVDDELQAVHDSVLQARDAGAGWSDIAVLVRNRKEGSLIASKLIGEGIPVISDDSLSLKSSLVVRRMISLLHSFENPANSVGGYLASSMGVEFPDSYHSLIDLCESLLRSLRGYDPESFDGETLFIQAFMDDLQSWVQVNGNNLRYYLEHWDDSELYIGSPANSGSVRVLTIHKSKGLEFPYVIFPFAEKVPMYKSDVHWCWLDASGTGLGDELTGIYPIDLDKSTAATLFSKDYEEERRQQSIDNMNIFYVAFTRAVKYLHVISKTPSKKCISDSGKADYVFNNFAEILYSYCRSTEWQTGSMYDFSRMERDSGSSVKDFPSSYPSIPLSGRLVASEDAMDYFGEDGTAGIGASARLMGIVLHKILSGVGSLDDVKPQVDAAVRDGLLSEEEGNEAFSELSARVSAHPEWFGKGMDARNEASLFAEDGQSHRPDRVVFGDDGVVVVDYKFGAERRKYVSQVALYMDLYRRMGYGNVTGAVWYVREDKVIKVD